MKGTLSSYSSFNDHEKRRAEWAGGVRVRPQAARSAGEAKESTLTLFEHGLQSVVVVQGCHTHLDLIHPTNYNLLTCSNTKEHYIGSNAINLVRNFYLVKYFGLAPMDTAQESSKVIIIWRFQLASTNRDDGDFFKDLRDEILTKIQLRTKIMMAKLAFVIGIFGVSVFSSKDGQAVLLYLISLVVFSYDFLILSEDYGIKKGGLFLRLNSDAPLQERNWERFCHESRDWFRYASGLFSSLFPVLASGVILFPEHKSSRFFYFWVAFNVGSFIGVWFLASKKNRDLDKITPTAKNILKEGRDSKS